MAFRTTLFAIIIIFTISLACNAQQEQAQFEVNKTALLSASSPESNRTNAAVLLLLSEDAQARSLLLQALSSSDNLLAKISICQALNKSNSWNETIWKRENFLQPLIGIILNGDDQQAKAAGQALIIYKYEDVGEKLKNIIDSPKQPMAKKLSALYALRIRPEKEATLDLITYAKSSDQQVATVAKRSLTKTLGIPDVVDKSEWQRIEKEFKRKDKDEFIADRLAAQNDRVRILEQQVKQWQEFYLDSLNKFYDSASDKEAFLLGQLASDRSQVMLWAVLKVSEWKNGGTLVSDNIGKKLIELIGDSQDDVRLEVAKLLASMSKLAPADNLFKQIELEQISEVKFEQFKAIGEAIYFALTPGSNIAVDPNVRLKVLDMAGVYLSGNSHFEVTEGARVIRKLLEQDGLGAEVSGKYLVMISGRYQKVAVENSELKGDLIPVMAMLCGNTSHYRVEAAKLYGQIFSDALGDSSAAVRGAAVGGLENIDEAAAIVTFREKRTYGDESDVVRANIIALSERIGGTEDLGWLADRLAVAGDNAASAKAIIEIVQRSVTADIISFYEANNAKLTKEQRLQILDIAAQKAAGEKLEKPQMDELLAKIEQLKSSVK